VLQHDCLDAVFILLYQDALEAEDTSYQSPLRSASVAGRLTW